ncbi:MAG TPA: CoA-binding protein, partial [Lutibacter sp.]|nr:CoA-binding protein [Lutibacter sp.]
EVSGVRITIEKVMFEDIDTITLYLNENNQKSFYDYILDLKPKRVLFNPGTENEELQNLLSKNKIAFEEACTLVLLSIGKY